MMTDWDQKALDALQLTGLGQRSQEAYVRVVCMLVGFYGKTPDEISEPELQQYFLHRKNRDHWSANTADLLRWIPVLEIRGQRAKMRAKERRAGAE